MKVIIKDVELSENCIVFNSVIDDFGIIINHDYGYNVLCINRDESSYDDVGENYLVYSNPLTIGELNRDNKSVPSISIV